MTDYKKFLLGDISDPVAFAVMRSKHVKGRLIINFIIITYRISLYRNRYYIYAKKYAPNETNNEAHAKIYKNLQLPIKNFIKEHEVYLVDYKKTMQECFDINATLLLEIDNLTLLNYLLKEKLGFIVKSNKWIKKSIQET